MPKTDADILVYRIVHFGNIDDILKNGIYVKSHAPLNNAGYVNIGNSEIIQSRESFLVKIDGYGLIGDYVPFYFGTQSIMLYNILTGQNGVLKQPANNIIYLCCYISDLIGDSSKFFFTDGQANKKFTEHFNDLKDLEKIDWKVVNGSDFKKTETDPDKVRRYQAEFLIHQHVPVKCINHIVVYNESRRDDVELLLTNNNLSIPVKVVKNDFYFYF